MNEHIVKSFEEELNSLTADVARMGGLAEAQIIDAVSSVTRRDATLAEAVVGDIERRSIRLIALRQPMALDLRRTVAAMKISSNLERCGDLARNIAKRALILTGSEPITPLTRSVGRMGKLVASRLKDVLDAYTTSDPERAANVWRRDDEIDEHYNSLFRELLTYMMGDPRTITPGAHLLFIAKNLERIGDHATNIAEIVQFEVTGDDIPVSRPKGETLSS